MGSRRAVWRLQKKDAALKAAACLAGRRALHLNLRRVRGYVDFQPAGGEVIGQNSGAGLRNSIAT